MAGAVSGREAKGTIEFAEEFVALSLTSSEKEMPIPIRSVGERMKPSSPCPTVPAKGALSLWQRANGLWQQANIRGLQVALGTGVSLISLWLAFRDVPLSQVAAAFSQADYRFVALALALVLVSPLARAVRWRLLYHPDQQGLSCLILAEVLLISQMLNIVVPARLGEVARIYFMGKTHSRARTLGTIAVEKWLDILMLLLLALLVPIFVSLPPWFRDSRLSLAVLATAFLGAALALYYSKDRLLTLVESASRFLPQGWRARIHRAAGLALGSLDVLRSPWVGLKLQGWSLLIWILSILVNYTVFLALGLPLPFAAALFLVVVLQVGVAVPSIPGKLGVFHYLCTLALGIFGLEKGAALGYAVLLYFVVFGPPALLGALFLWWESVRRRQVRPAA
ncbi:MAG: flippase-like domain-containing protein [Chloroflexi bacterium]|nr:flippase-like domain-containing protein [Chloroflexota bacterium]